MVKRMAFDIDGCVIDLQTPLKSYFKKTFNIELPDKAFSTYKIEEVTNIPYEQVFACINACIADVYSQKLYPGARSFIVDYVRKNNTQALFVTNRWDRPNTIKLLDNYFHDIFYDVIFVKGSKVRELKKINTEIYIEDRIENAEEISNAGIFTILLERPWNQFGSKGSKNLVRVKDWFELKEVYEKLEERSNEKSERTSFRWD